MSRSRTITRRVGRLLAGSALGALVAMGLGATPAGAAATGDCGATNRLPRPQDQRFYVQCANGIATALPCPTGQVFDLAQQTCDLPERVRPAVATLTSAGPAKLSGLLFGVKNLSTTVRMTDAPAGLDGVPVTFTTVGGKTLCTAVTDQFGAARCDTPSRLNLPLDEILRGYRASYAGITGIYRPSSATGTIALL
ncbi:chitin binding peritrophin-A domain-containing protein [Streptomyces sp. G-G2]|uniref:chitin binding peritrophin-A domain-containing protein n=1 Tax=Streptomyces sp. G-G2 TaxID=3046201 RepID=UPI0024B999CC|nr:chitin binding peritrophin-A domain-containing protein [Streptomyces sp. G-G2]MDJ0381676.1 chitin binding domain-containing protein [Streptomyces sp. G-G2]